MGQMFNACVYDTKKRICSVIDADKFHASCYSYSDAVAETHYLLRQKAYHVMWGGSYIVVLDFLSQELSKDMLLGISTYTDREYIEDNKKSNQEDDEDYRNNVKFIIENAASWQWINAWDEAQDFFDYENTQSVSYEGFLVNRTKKLAVNLHNYYKKSLSMTKSGDLYAIDPIPVLTETGGGLSMALFDGMTSSTTEKLNTEWCGDLLQIVKNLPDGYKRINCCFADAWGRARFCHREYGVDEKGFLLEQRGKRFLCCSLDLDEKRSLDSFVKVKISANTVNFSTVPIDQVEG